VAIYDLFYRTGRILENGNENTGRQQHSAQRHMIFGSKNAFLQRSYYLCEPNITLQRNGNAGTDIKLFEKSRKFVFKRNF
jgi:hypothetical protein